MFIDKILANFNCPSGGGAHRPAYGGVSPTSSTQGGPFSTRHRSGRRAPRCVFK